MSRSVCEQLDDYLADALDGVAVASFVAHLEDCDTCRQAVDEHWLVTRLLRHGVDELEAVPPLLIERTERALRLHDRRRRVRLVGGLATAAVILIGVGIALRTQPRPLEQDVVDTEVIVAAPVEAKPSAKSLVRVSLLNPDEAIVVPIETKAENVSIVWIYPTVKVAANAAVPAGGMNVPE